MSEDTNIDGPEGDRTLIAEYVLGLLDALTHERVRRAIASNPRLAREEAFWRAEFSQLDEEFAEEAPPAYLAGAIEARVFGSRQAQGHWFRAWNSLAFWRGLAAGAAAVAVVAAVANLNLVTPRSSADLQLVAALEAEDSEVRFLALYDSAERTVRLTGLSGAPGADEDFELWAIEEGQQPVSLGVVAAGGHSSVRLPPRASADWGEGSVLAITLEPEGGSPTGQPTGPLMASGVATRI